MPSQKSSFLDKVLGRIGRLDAQGLQTVVERLARERTFLETLFNTIDDGILVVDETGRILYYNQAVSRMLNLPSEAAEGQHIKRVLPELNWEELSKLDAAGKPSVVRHEFEISYPTTRFIRLFAAPLNGETDRGAGLALILHDATEARQQTFEAIESERIHSLTLLAASVAHEIGNPLNALHIHLQLMNRELKKLRQFVTDPKKPSKRKMSNESAAEDCLDVANKMDQYLEVAKGEIVRLDYIVTQFLQAIRPTNPKFCVTSLNAVVTETLDLLRPELENRGLIIREHLSKVLPSCSVDPGQVKQALVNLVKNAMQAMTKGGRLTMETGEGNEGVFLLVSDTGGGIPNEQLNQIFEPFFTTKKKGSGLGLMIVQRIVREHGGRIEVESNVGQGTTFKVWFPLHEKRPKLLEAQIHG